MIVYVSYWYTKKRFSRVSVLSSDLPLPTDLLMIRSAITSCIIIMKYKNLRAVKEQ